MPVPLCSFAQHYRGRHRPEDAAWWLEHPGTLGPSGAPPAQWLFLEAVDELHAAGHDGAAAALLDVLGHLLDHDRRTALDAVHALGPTHPLG